MSGIQKPKRDISSKKYFLDDFWFQPIGTTSTLVKTMLLDEVEKRFRNKGVNIAYLEVRESNTNAQRIYRHRGYQYVRTAENYYGDENGYIMTKKLDH